MGNKNTEKLKNKKHNKQARNMTGSSDKRLNYNECNQITYELMQKWCKG